MTDDPDLRRLRRAFRLAARGLGRTSPEPAAAALVVRGDRIVDRAVRGAPDEPHPALRLGDPRPGDTLVTSFEPPARAAETLRGYARVVVGARDPRAPGRGLAALRRRGVTVRGDCLVEDAEAVDEAFFAAVRSARSFVVLKAAASLDGRIATRTGQSQWITGPEARAYGHRLRDRLDAILVGAGTVRADDPALTARFAGARNPVRVVLSRALELPPSAQLIRTAREVRTIACATRAAPAETRRALARAGVEVWIGRKDRSGRLDPRWVLERLYAAGLLSVLVEGGGATAGAFVDAGLVDRLCLFLAPLLIGGEAAPSFLRGQGTARLGDALRLASVDVERVGSDVLLTGRTVADPPAHVHGNHRGRRRGAPRASRSGRR